MDHADIRSEMWQRLNDVREVEGEEEIGVNGEGEVDTQDAVQIQMWPGFGFNSKRAIFGKCSISQITLLLY